MIEALKRAGELLPLFVKWVGVMLSQGKDPQAELEAMMDTAELAAIRAEKAKFGG